MPEHTPAPTSSRAVYGFILQLSFKLFFYIYLTWAIIPEKWFESAGITYLPQRYWAVAVPIYLLIVFTTFAFLIYPALGLIMTPDWSDLKTIKDKHSLSGTEQCIANYLIEFDSEHVCCPWNIKKCKKADFDARSHKEFRKCIPSMKDLDVIKVSRHLYLK